MHRVNLSVPIYLPDAWYLPLRRLKHQVLRRNNHHLFPNSLGDREVEWSWIAAHMPYGPGEALDFGPEGSYLGLIAAERGFNVMGVDLRLMERNYVHPRLRFLQCDVRRLASPKGHFDLVINCSTVEHVGLAGRYGVTEQEPDGDLEAMAYLRGLMKTGAVMLLTVPVGQDEVFMPMCRVYGVHRLPRLLEGYALEKESYWVKDNQNRWIPTQKKTALAFKASVGAPDPLRNIYNLGCFVLRRS